MGRKHHRKAIQNLPKPKTTATPNSFIRLYYYTSGYFRQKKLHRLYPPLAICVSVVVGMIVSNVIGAICLVVSVYLALVIFIPWTLLTKKFNKLSDIIIRYSIPAILCISLSIPMWNHIVGIFPNNLNDSKDTTTQLQDVFPKFSVGDQNQKITFSYGNSSFDFTVHELMSGGRKFFVTNNYEPFFAYLDNDNLYVDVNTYGNDRFSPLQIIRNNLIEVPQGWDVNFLNGYALELVDDKQQPIIQLIYNNPYQVIINGYITYPGGFAFTNGEITHFDKYPPMNELLKRLFKYPSSKYEGIKEDN